MCIPIDAVCPVIIFDYQKTKKEIKDKIIKTAKRKKEQDNKEKKRVPNKKWVEDCQARRRDPLGHYTE